MKNLFDLNEANEAIDRIQKLTPESERQWGKMTVAQMMAHCNVAYEMAFEDKHKKAGPVKRFFLKMFVKKIVVGPDPYKKNNPTAPEFKITETKDFAVEQARLIEYIKKTQQLGAAHFEGKESNSFGAMTSDEWNVSFSKHLDHHLTQFGV